MNFGRAVHAFIRLMVIGLCGSCVAHASAWTRSYEDVVPVKQRRTPQYVMSRGETAPIEPFKQLIFSWNADMPNTGAYVFAVQLRDAASKKWSDWHRMIEWGPAIHRSFFSRSKGIDAAFCLLRAEMEHGRRADAFRLKVTRSTHEPLGALTLMSVCTSDMTKMTSEVKKNVAQGLASCYVPDVPIYSQRLLDHPRTGSLCAPTTCSMLAGFVINQDVDPVPFANAVYDEGFNSFGNWSLVMAQSYVAAHGKANFRVKRLNGFADLYKLLQQGIPVGVSLRGVLSNAAKVYESGHLVVVVGWHAPTGKVFCHDPAFASLEAVPVAYALDEFLACWEHSHRLAYVMSPVRGKKVA